MTDTTDNIQKEFKAPSETRMMESIRDDVMAGNGFGFHFFYDKPPRAILEMVGQLVFDVIPHGEVGMIEIERHADYIFIKKPDAAE
jgi:hypothetical protein